MKIVIISDTHEKHREMAPLPDGDILINCGDFTKKGSLSATEDFLNWFSLQPQKYKIFCAGNHELNLDLHSAGRYKALNLIKKYSDKFNIHYLENSSVIIEGFKIYGSPFTPFFFNWAFNRHRGKAIAAEWKHIPDDTNILITHGPPFEILDETDTGFSMYSNEGCIDLRDRIKQLKDLKASFFGHIHREAAMVKTITIDGVVYANASICDERNKPINKPIEIEI